ncbi:MAG: alpha glucosidase [Alphaproteobacteria bacterium]
MRDKQMTQQRSEQENRSNEWWRGACLYQIYPRSFLDTNGDGIGDLPGITEKLDYVAALGVDGIWISPLFTSPMKDFGYDVSNYRDIDPMFGNLENFKTLLARAHVLGLKIIIDLVLSHTSNRHPWFNEKPEYYVWADPKPDMFGARVPPNNWVSVFGGSAWEWHEGRQQYYLHNFLKEQPDLNFHNPDVQNEALDIAKFWLDLGVDGFRLDVINFLFHDRELRDNPPRDESLGAATQFEGDDPYSAQAHIYDKSRPENLEFIKKLRALMDQYDSRFTIGEIGDDHPYERSAQYSASGLLNTCYNTHMMSGQHKPLTTDLIRTPVETALKHGGWPSWAFSNHDVVRAASRWHAPKDKGGDGFTHNPALSKMLIALLGCLYGTAFLYQGEELGLPEAKLKFEDLQDPWGKHLWPEWQGRDGCRTPMPWTETPPSKSWLPTPETHSTLSVAVQENDPASTLNFTRDFINWRKNRPALKTGTIHFHETASDMLIFERRHRTQNETQNETQNFLCAFNLTDTENPLPPMLPHCETTAFPQSDKPPAQTLPPYAFWISEIKRP